MTAVVPPEQRLHKLAYARWAADAPRFDWDLYAGADYLPQPLNTGRAITAAVTGPGMAAFLNESWSVSDAIVACSVLAYEGVLGYLSDSDMPWPVLVSSRGSREFTRCLVDGCAAPTYVQRLGSGRAPERCIEHARRARVLAALGRDRELVRSLAGRALIDG